MRVKRGVKARRRRNKLLKVAKGFRGRSKNTIRQARSRLEKAMAYAYVGRKIKKRDFRSLWITRINAAARLNGLSYSRFMDGLNKSNIELNRKVLADIGAKEPKVFEAIAQLAKQD